MHIGFVIIFPLLIIIPLIFRNLYYIFIKIDQINFRSIQIILWLLTVFTSLSYNQYLSIKIKNNMTLITHKIEQFHETHHSYPNSLALIGYNNDFIKRNYVIYKSDVSTYFLYYRSIWTPYDGYIYDIKNQRWEFQGG